MNSIARRNLIFARVGDGSLHKKFLADPSRERNWDLQLSAFGHNEAQVRDDGDLPLSIDRGTKWDSVLRYFTANPHLLEKYDYIMFPDDDILFESSESLDRFFDICREHDLFVAQPACTVESYSLSFQVRCPAFRLRFATFIECMAPCIKSSYLKSTILPLYEKWTSGWGVDLIWALLMPDPAFKAAIVDEVPMTHTRRHFTGPIYKDFKDLNVDPRREVQEVAASYSNRLPKSVIYGAVLRNGRRIGGPTARLMNGWYVLRYAHLANSENSMMRAGLGMLVRSVTLANYRPIQVLPIPTETRVGGCQAGAT